VARATIDRKVAVNFLFCRIVARATFSGADRIAHPVIGNIPICGKSGHRIGPNSMTGFSTDGVLEVGDRAPIPYALYRIVRNWNA
jgi:hypothetical protein